MSRARDFANLAGSADAGTITGDSLVINGDMSIAQRRTTTTDKADTYVIDRFKSFFGATDELAITASQSTTVPSDQVFKNSWKLEVTTKEDALAADELAIFRTILEAQTLQHLGYGTSAAKSLTVSFWVRSSLVGKYSFLFYHFDATRSNLQSFTINTADTWEYKTITIDGDTDSGATINDDNGEGLQLTWVLAAGTDYTGTPHTGWGAYTQTDDYAFSDQVNFLAQTGTFYITGVKLEVGTKATPFKHESYAENLRKCQRFFFKTYERGDDPGTATTAGQVMTHRNSPIATSAGTQHIDYNFPVSMRAKPTIVIYNPNDGTTGEGHTSGGVDIAMGKYTNSNGIQHVLLNNSGAAENAATWTHVHFTASIEY